jgi:hypothetical protein
MSFFGDILHKIIPSSAPAEAAPAPVEAAPSDTAAADAAHSDGDATAAAAPAEPVDVEAVLNQMAAEKGDHGNWHESIVDLLKLLGLESSLSARKTLADELGVHVAEAGTAEENIALLKAVMTKLAENGGVVPDSLKH